MPFIRFIIVLRIGSEFLARIGLLTSTAQYGQLQIFVETDFPQDVH